MVDDLDGVSPADEAIRFAIDGASYEIDLTTDHAEELRSHLNTYVGAGRRASDRLNAG